MTIQPRNDFVLLKLHLKPDEQVGKLIVPTARHEYTEAEVLAVGPGLVQAAGGVSETHDLKVGQQVLVKHKRKMQRQAGGKIEEQLFDEGVKLRELVGTREDLYLFGQASILGILAEPKLEGDAPFEFHDPRHGAILPS